MDKDDFPFRARSDFSGLFLNSLILQYRTVLYLLESLLLEVDFFTALSDTVRNTYAVLWQWHSYWQEGAFIAAALLETNNIFLRLLIAIYFYDTSVTFSDLHNKCSALIIYLPQLFIYLLDKLKFTQIKQVWDFPQKGKYEMNTFKRKATEQPPTGDQFVVCVYTCIHNTCLHVSVYIQHVSSFPPSPVKRFLLLLSCQRGQQWGSAPPAPAGELRR